MWYLMVNMSKWVACFSSNTVFAVVCKWKDKTQGFMFLFLFANVIMLCDTYVNTQKRKSECFSMELSFSSISSVTYVYSEVASHLLSPSFPRFRSLAAGPLVWPTLLWKYLRSQRLGSSWAELWLRSLRQVEGMWGWGRFPFHFHLQREYNRERHELHYMSFSWRFYPKRLPIKCFQPWRCKLQTSSKCKYISFK